MSLRTLIWGVGARVVKVDADEAQPQLMATAEWAAQEGALLHETRGFRQPRDPLVGVALDAAELPGDEPPLVAA